MSLEDRDVQQRWLAHAARLAVEAGAFPSQRKLASAAGITPSVLNAAVTGDRGASAESRRKLVVALTGDEATADKLLKSLAHAPPPPHEETERLITRLLLPGDPAQQIAGASGVEAGGGLSSVGSTPQRGYLLESRFVDELRRRVTGTIIRDAFIQAGDHIVRPDVYLPDQHVVFEIKMGLAVQARLQSVIGQAVVMAAALNARTTVVTEPRPTEAVERALRAANLGVVWFDGDELVGFDLDTADQ